MLVCVRVFNGVWKAANQFQMLCRLTIGKLISFLNTEDDKEDVLMTG